MGSGKQFHPGNSYDQDSAKRAINPSIKGTKSWSSAAVAAALELVDPLVWTLAVTHCGRFFFFFFFFLAGGGLKQEGPAYMARPFHISLRQLPIHAHAHTPTLLDHFMPAASKLATKAKHAG
eukprot:FR736859.1.p4 GENE.FR736859.1~~FR736859.1.p4  ORF type:complete len:122 (-),score=35.24 FR736859.1:410-775(-)